ncbi:flavodoxin domain-containing protein [Massilia sp. H-1]|nr:flavodoxin domain-containing protein [Massilia sp. H-1]
MILVGSENNSTWGFARSCTTPCETQGQRVHTAPMNQFAAHYPAATTLFLLTSTYGDGDAPASANHFLARLAQASPDPKLRFAVLGFGDQQFLHFCQFARDVDSAMSSWAGSARWRSPPSTASRHRNLHAGVPRPVRCWEWR